LQPDFLLNLPGNSLDHVELIMALEEGLDVDIPDDDARKFRTVHDVLNYIERSSTVKKRRKGGHVN
jgi:acyl carrier protein